MIGYNRDMLNLKNLRCFITFQFSLVCVYIHNQKKLCLYIQNIKTESKFSTNRLCK